MPHTLKALPYESNALEPFISSETLMYHHGKHLKAYVDNLNTLIQGTEFADSSLIEIIRQASGPIFNNAAQIWNHDFYFQCFGVEHKEPTSSLLNLLEKNFGGFENFKAAFTKEALANFGSGWTWLLQEGSKLEIFSTKNADTPIAKGLHPILTCDVWEHAYYIDYRNARPKYLQNFFEVINWEFVQNNLTK